LGLLGAGRDLRPDRTALSCIVTRIEAQGLALLPTAALDSSCARRAKDAWCSSSRTNRELDPPSRARDQNPLGGLRGSAQLLERELDRPELRDTRR